MKTTLAGLAAATMLLAIASPRPAAALPIANLGADQAQTGANVIQVQYRRHHRRHVRRVVRHYRHYRRPRARVVVRRPAYRWGGGWGYRRAYWGYPYRSYSYVGYGPYNRWGYPYRYDPYPYRYWGPGFSFRIGPFGFGFW